MTRREIARLCFKVLAVYTLISALASITQFGWFMQMAWQGPGGGSLLAQVFALLTSLTPLLQIGLAVWLWLKAGVVAAWAVGYDLQDSPEEPDGIAERSVAALSADVIQAIVFSCLGVWVLIGALPDLFATITGALYTSLVADYDVLADQLNPQTAAWGTGILIRLAIGFWLLFGAAGLVRLLNRFRGIGLEDAGDGETNGGPDAGAAG